MRFNELRPQLTEAVATDVVRTAVVKALSNTGKFLKGGPNQLAWDIALFTFVPSMRETVWKHMVERDWVGLALDLFTLRGNFYTVMAAVVAQIVRDIYDDIFLNGTDTTIEEFKNIPGDIPTVKGHLEVVATSYPAVAAARIRAATPVVWELIKTGVKGAYADFHSKQQAELLRKAGQDDADFSQTRITQPAFGNPNITNQARTQARNKLANTPF